MTTASTKRLTAGVEVAEHSVSLRSPMPMLLRYLNCLPNDTDVAQQIMTLLETKVCPMFGHGFWVWRLPLLLIALGCHLSSKTMYAGLESEIIAPVDAEIIAAQRACVDQHDVQACSRVAEYWEGENGHPFDPKKAFQFASRGCGGGDGLACAVLGRHWENGLGAVWAPRNAIRFYELACTAGTGLGCMGLGRMYARGYGVAVDRAKAKAYFDRAHSLWLAACLGSELRWCTYAAGSASAHEGEPTANELYQRACDHGIARGCIHLLHNQLEEPTRLRDATMHELERWCSLGASAACEELASAYDQPNGPRDPERAAALTQRACLLGEPQACVKLGILHEIETGIPRDDAVARRYFNHACNRGAPMGCLYLAQDTDVAGGSPREVARAAQRGCEMGSIEACDLLINLYVAYRDEEAATHWATETCRVGFFNGCQYLIAHNGSLPKTIEDPVHFYREACDRKISLACLTLPDVVQTESDVLRGVVAAAAKQDTTAFAKLAADGIYMENLEFNDPDCARQFSGIVVLNAAQHRAFLRCLANVGVHVEAAADPRSPPSLAYRPDMKLAVKVRDGIVQELLAFSSSKASPATGAARTGTNPHAGFRNVASGIMETIRIAGEKEIYPDPITRDRISALGTHKLVGSFKLYVNARGAITSVTMLTSTGSMPYDRKIERTIYSWRYQPFMIDGKPTPVSTIVTYIYTQRWF